MFNKSTKTNLIDTILDSGMITMCPDNLTILVQNQRCNSDIPGSIRLEMSTLATVVAYEMEAASGYDHQWDQEDIIDLIHTKR